MDVSKEQQLRPPRHEQNCRSFAISGVAYVSRSEPLTGDLVLEP